MSDQYDPSAADAGDPTPGAVEPELLGPAERPARSSRRWAAVGAGAAAVVVAAGAGAWGVSQLMAGGESPASAVPGTAIGYLAMDLDPSATQKIEALRIMKKFPALAEELDLDAKDDIRRWVFEEIQESGQCPDLDYAGDVEPWLGDRAAVAAVPSNAGKVRPLVVLQVSDADAAVEGVAALSACSGEEVATAVVGEYLLLGEDQVELDVMAVQAESAPLQDDPGFTSWMEQVGSPGIITGYVSADMPRYLVEEMTALDDAGADGLVAPGRPFGPGAGDLDRLEAALEDFDGGALSVRFADGGVEATMVSGIPADYPAGQVVPDTLAALPSTTALAFSFGVPEGWVAMAADGVAQDTGQDVEEMWAELSAMSGLDLPADAETLLGRGMTVALDSDVDVAGLVAAEDPTGIPVAVQLTGDAPGISRVLDRLRGMAGPDGDLIVSEESGDTVTVGVSPDYVGTLAAGAGDLGGAESFRRVVPEADRAEGVFYVDFDAADGWLKAFAEDGGKEARELRDNLAPLEAAGGSAWRDGEVYHVSFRISTDE